MKKIYYIVLTVVVVAILSSFLPWVLSLMMPQVKKDPFVGFSPYTYSFIISETTADPNTGKVTHDIREIDPVTGQFLRSLTEDERDSLIPEIYANRLQARGQMPDSLNGVEMTMHNIRRNRWMFSSRPHYLNRNLPTMYPLMESMPAKFELENPSVALYMPGHVEIIDIESNAIDSVKTQRFARKFNDIGFTFPAIAASANITTRKAYDNGYLLIDANHEIYHLKMQASRPSMAHIKHPADVTPTHVFIMENGDRAHYGLVTTAEGRTFAILRDDNYTLQELPGVTFNPEKQGLNIIKTLFAWTIKISDDDKAQWIALRTDNRLSPITTYEYDYERPAIETVGKWIFPFTTSFTSEQDQYVYMRVGNWSWRAVCVWVFILIVLLITYNYKNKKK